MKYEFELDKNKKKESVTKLRITMEPHGTDYTEPWVQIKVNGLPVVAICPKNKDGYVWVGGILNDCYDWESIGLVAHPSGAHRPVHKFSKTFSKE